MTASRPLLTALRLGAIVLAVGVGGYLVVGAQRRATGGGGEAPERTLAQPTLAPETGAEEVLPRPADPYLFSSKSAAIEVLPEDATVLEDGRLFLPSSKSSVQIQLPELSDAGGDVRVNGARSQVPTYLLSSKILSPDALRMTNEAAPPPPEDPAFLRSSKSLTIDGALLDSQPQENDAGAHWQSLSDEERRAVFFPTSKSLSPDALPGARSSRGEQDEAPTKSGGSTNDAGKAAKDAAGPKKD